jgi:hypothetical protein
MIHCITCKTIIPSDMDEEFGEIPSGPGPFLTPQGHNICASCVSPCGLDAKGIVMHHQCPDGCMVVTTWEEHQRFDNTLPF